MRGQRVVITLKMENLNYDSHDMACFFYVVLNTTYLFLPIKLTARGQLYVSLLYQARYECFNINIFCSAK